MLSVFQNLGIMIAFMAVGFLFVKAKIFQLKDTKLISAALVYLFSPCMMINSFIQIEYSAEKLKQIGLFFVVSFLLQFISLTLLYFIFRKKCQDPKYRILIVASTLGNVGFFGMPLVMGLFPDEPIVACYSCAYVLSMNLLAFTFGVFMITKEKKYISLESAVLNPTSIAIFIALPLMICKVQFPTLISAGLSSMTKLVAPLCMVVLGMRLSATKLAHFFTRGFVYLTCLLKLVAFPLFALLLTYFIPGLSQTFKISLFVLSMAPTGVLINSLSELHKKEEEYSANVVLMTTLLCTVTIPLLLLIVM